MTVLKTPRNQVQPLLDSDDVSNLSDFIGQTWVDLDGFKTALDAIHAQLDADSGVTDVDYNAGDPAARTASMQQGIGQGLTSAFMLDSTWHTFTSAVVADLTAIRTAITTLTAKLDADAGVTDTTYASGNDPAAITATAQTIADVEARNQVSPQIPFDDIAAIRTFSSEVAADVTALRAAIVGITAQLDADGTVNDTTYASANDPAAQVVAALAAS